MSNITSADATIILSVAGLFSGTQIQGFTADDIFDVADVTNAETIMGLDGILSAGWIPALISQTFVIQAGSPSEQFFDEWINAEKQKRSKLSCSGVITLLAVGKIYSPGPGFLKTYTPMTSAKKVLQPRKFVIEWQDIGGAPV